MNIINSIEKDGYIVIREGIYLSTQECIIEDSKGCYEDEHDFTIYKYWMTMNDSDFVQGFDTIWEAIKEIDELEEYNN